MPHPLRRKSKDLSRINAKLPFGIHREHLHEGLTTLPSRIRHIPDFKQPVGSCAR
jgi:hypothetical protein